jgi:O-methyltransferase involved in polyketide biosynthesis
MSKWDGVSNTAHYTAQAWVQGRLDQAEVFDTPKGRWLYHGLEPFVSLAARLPSLPDLRQVLRLRHAMIDRLLVRAEPIQVIEMAAGLSPRGLSFSKGQGWHYLEVDLPRLIETKRKILSTTPASLHLAAFDLLATEDYFEALRENLVSGRTAVITEGLIHYFPLALQSVLFRRIAELLRRVGGGVYLTDVHHEEDVQKSTVVRFFRYLLHRFTSAEQPEYIPDATVGRRMVEEAGFDALAIFGSEDFSELQGKQQVNDLNVRIYQARIGG